MTPLSNDIAKAIDRIYVLNHHSRDTFADVLELVLCTLKRHTPGYEERYMQTVRRMQVEAVRATPEVFGLLMHHFLVNEEYEDILGPVYMTLAGKWKQAGLGQYFTPWCICVMMSEFLFHDLETLGPDNVKTINEPCVGSGAMLLAAKEVVARRQGREAVRWLKVSGQDLDPLCCTMAEIQLLMTDDVYMHSWALANVGTLGV